MSAQAEPPIEANGAVAAAPIPGDGGSPGASSPEASTAAPPSPDAEAPHAPAPDAPAGHVIGTPAGVPPAAAGRLPGWLIPPGPPRRDQSGRLAWRLAQWASKRAPDEPPDVLEELARLYEGAGLKEMILKGHWLPGRLDLLVEPLTEVVGADQDHARGARTLARWRNYLIIVPLFLTWLATVAALSLHHIAGVVLGTVAVLDVLFFAALLVLNWAATASEAQAEERTTAFRKELLKLAASQDDAGLTTAEAVHMYALELRRLLLEPRQLREGMEDVRASVTDLRQAIVDGAGALKDVQAAGEAQIEALQKAGEQQLETLRRAMTDLTLKTHGDQLKLLAEARDAGMIQVQQLRREAAAEIVALRTQARQELGRIAALHEEQIKRLQDAVGAVQGAAGDVHLAAGQVHVAAATLTAASHEVNQASSTLTTAVTTIEDSITRLRETSDKMAEAAGKLQSTTTSLDGHVAGVERQLSRLTTTGTEIQQGLEEANAALVDAAEALNLVKDIDLQASQVLRETLQEVREAAAKQREMSEEVLVHLDIALQGLDEQHRAASPASAAGNGRGR